MVLILYFLIASGWRRQEKGDYDGFKSKKGIVVYPSDLTSVGCKQWVRMAHDAGINLIGIHSDTRLETLSKLKSFINSEKGELFFSECKKYDIQVEYEMHILMEFLPREIFKDHPEYFREDKSGKRNNDYNMCFTSEPAMEIVKKNAVEMAKWLKPTSHRYFFWTDDVQLYCHCSKCSQYSPSEQVLLYENAILEALREYDPRATVAHLAYVQTIILPEKVKPLPGIFFEFAPINRDYTKPMSEEQVNNLKGNLRVFPPETAHILEYWLDVSKFSGWKKDNLKQPLWNREQCSQDLEIYTGLGVRSITTFGAWINADYINKFGKKHTTGMLNEYGEVLEKYMK